MERIEQALKEEQAKPPTSKQIEQDYEQYKWRFIPDKGWNTMYYQFLN